MSEVEPVSPVARRILALPLAGVSLFAAVIAYDIGTGLIFNYTFHVVAAASIGLMLLVRAAVREHPSLLRTQANWSMVAISLGSSLYATWMMHALDWTDENTTRAALFATFGTATGLFAYSRTLKVLIWCVTHPLPVCIALVIAFSPIIFHSYHTLAWQWTAGTTVAIVKAILWLCGITLTSESQTVPDLQFFNEQGDFVQNIQSAHFGIGISWACSGIEGMVFFCCFLSAFILFDWHLFGRVKGIALVYPLLLGLVTVINAIRIASIFFYGNWLTIHAEGSVDVHKMVDAFHSNAGLFIYAAVFALILPLVYWLARRQTGVKLACRESDEPAPR